MLSLQDVPTIDANIAEHLNLFSTFHLKLSIFCQFLAMGKNDEANLALACRSCNLRKGTRTHGTLSNSKTEVEFFHPRNQQWNNHFRIDADSGKIIGITPVGKVTVAYLAINSPAQVIARQLWIRLGLFPPADV